jgi:hypothetical protein
VFAQRSDTGIFVKASAVTSMLQIEATAGMTTPGFYGEFQHRAEKVKDDLLFFLIDAKRKGLKVGAYGAAAKGNTLLNFAGIRPDLLPYVVDKNPAKQGKYMPGSRIPVVNEAYLRAHSPNFVVILPWNLRVELAAQLAYTADWGAELVVAVPKLALFQKEARHA